MPDIFELEGKISLDTSGLDSGVSRVSGALDSMVSGFSNANAGAIALGTSVGVMGAELVMGGVKAIRRWGDDALEAVRYNERLRISVERLTYEDMLKERQQYETVVVGKRLVTVEQQIAAATRMSKKETKDQTKALEEAADAEFKLITLQTNLNLAQAKAANYAPGKKTSPEVAAAQQAKLWDNVRVIQKSIADTQEKINAGSAIHAKTAEIAANAAQRGNYYQNITEKRAIPISPQEEAEIQNFARQKTKELIRDIERMAVLSPFNKKNVADTFFNFQAVAGFKLDEAKKWTQMLVDLATVKGVEPENIENIAYAIGKIRQNGKMQAREAQSLVLNRIPIYEILGETLSKSTAELREMQKQGKLTTDVVMPAIEKYLLQYDGAAKAAAGSISGVVESINDIGTLITTDFLEPLLKPIALNLADLVQGFVDSPIRADLAKKGQEIGEQLLIGVKDVMKFGDIFIGKMKIDNNPVKALKNTLLDIVRDPEISTGFRNMAAAFLPIATAADGVTDIFIANWPKIKPIVEGVGNALLILAGSSVIGKVVGALKPLGALLSSPLGKIALALGVAKAAWDNNMFGVRDSVKSFLSDFVPDFDALKKQIDNFWQLLAGGDSAAASWDRTIKAVVDPRITDLAKPLLKTFDDISAFFKGEISFAEAGKRIGENIRVFINEVVEGIEPGGIISDMWAKVQGKALKIENEFVRIIGEITPGMKLSAQEFGASIGKWIIDSIKFAEESIANEFAIALGRVEVKDKARPAINRWLTALDELFSEGLKSVWKGFSEQFEMQVFGPGSSFERFFHSFAALKALGDEIIRRGGIFNVITRSPFDAQKFIDDFDAQYEKDVKERMKKWRVKESIPVDISLTPEINPKGDPLWGITEERLNAMGLTLDTVDPAIRPSIIRKGGPTVSMPIPVIATPVFSFGMGMGPGTGGPAASGQDMINKQLAVGYGPLFMGQNPINVPVPVNPVPVVDTTTPTVAVDDAVGNAIVDSVIKSASNPATNASVSAAIKAMIDQSISESANAMGLVEPYTNSPAYKMIGMPIGLAIKQGIGDSMTEVVAALDQINTRLQSTGQEVVGPNGVQPKMDGFVTFVQTRLAPAIDALKVNTFDPMNTSLSIMASIIDGLIVKFGLLNTAVSNFKPPPVLTPGSPTPFETGLRGIYNAVSDLNNTPLDIAAAGYGVGGVSVAQSQSQAPAQPIVMQVYADSRLIAEEAMTIVDGRLAQESRRYGRR